MGKAKREHFPPIEAILGKPAVPIQYFKEDNGNFRLVAYVNMPDTDLRTAVLETLATAYALGEYWNLQGLGCLRTGKYHHVVGFWSMEKPSPKAPQIVSMMFEIERGLAESMSDDGGVFISEIDRNDGLEAAAKNPFRLDTPHEIPEE